MASNAFPIKCIVTALVLSCATSSGAETLDEMFGALSKAGPEEAARIEERIARAWSDSGSATIDLIWSRGAEAMEQGDWAAAVEHFTAALDYAPGFAEAYNGRATAFFQQGRFGPALDDIRQVLVLEPRHFGAMRGLGLILEELGEEATALEVYRRILAIHPHLADVARSAERLELMLDGRPI